MLRILNWQQNKKGWKKWGMRAAPSNFHFPSSYHSHFGWIASRIASFFFFFLIEIQLPCGDAKACKHCCPWKVFSIVLNQINAAPHFIALRQGPIRNVLLQLGNQCKDTIWQKVRVIACFSLWKWKLLRQVRFFVTPWTIARQAPLSMGILQTRILERVAISFSRGSSCPGDWTQDSCIASRFFTIWTTGEDFQSLMGLDAFTRKVPMATFSSGGRSWVSSTGFQVGGTLPAVGSLPGCLLPPLCGFALNSFRDRRLANCPSWKGWQKTLPALFDLPHPNTTLGMAWVQSTQSPHDSPALAAVTALFLTRKEMGPSGLSINF